MIYYEDLNLSLFRLQLETELILNGGKDRGTNVRRRVERRVVKPEIEITCDSCPIYHGATHDVG